MEPEGSLPHSQVPAPVPTRSQFDPVHRTKVSIKAGGKYSYFLTKPVFTVRSCQHLAQPASWKITPCRLSATAYSIYSQLPSILGPGSVVGITTEYGLDRPGIEYRWGRVFRTCPDRPWGPPSLLHNGYRVSPGVKSGRGVTLTPHALLVPWLRKSRAIPLLPLRSVRPVQSLSTCARVHFTFTFTYLLHGAESFLRI